MAELAPIEVARPYDDVVLVTFRQPGTDEQFAAYLRVLDDHVARGTRFGFVFDASRSTGVSANQRRVQADWIRDNFDTLQRTVIGGAFVLTNPLTRLILASVLAMQRLPYRHVVVRSVGEGIDWLRARQKVA
jgi:hypothetical protein